MICSIAYDHSGSAPRRAVIVGLLEGNVSGRNVGDAIEDLKVDEGQLIPEIGIKIQRRRREDRSPVVVSEDIIRLTFSLASNKSQTSLR